MRGLGRRLLLPATIVGAAALLHGSGWIDLLDAAELRIAVRGALVVAFALAWRFRSSRAGWGALGLAAAVEVPGIAVQPAADDVALALAIEGVWELANRTTPLRFPPGVYNHRSMEQGLPAAVAARLILAGEHRDRAPSRFDVAPRRRRGAPAQRPAHPERLRSHCAAESFAAVSSGHSQKPQADTRLHSRRRHDVDAPLVVGPSGSGSASA